jgi:hypothetical protein
MLIFRRQDGSAFIVQGQEIKRFQDTPPDRRRAIYERIEREVLADVPTDDESYAEPQDA